jgi:hypothetical protein
MTEHRELKRRIRERAARTGESYTTARRHVLAQAGPAPVAPPAGVVPGYPGLGGGAHHESTLVAHLLTQAGHVAPHTGEPYSEAMLCGLGGGVGFLYAVFAYAGEPPILTVVAQHHPQPWLPAALDRLRIGYAEKHGGARSARTELLADLDAGRAVYCVVGRPGLPWHADGMGLASDPYPLVVAGRDGDALLVDDRAPRSIEVDAFVAAWSSYRKGRHHRVTVAAPDGPVDLPAAVRAAIATTVAHLTGPVLGNAFDVNMGFSGMTRLAEQLRDRTTRHGWVRRFAGAERFALRRLSECLEEQYTAPGATRPLYADFLDEAAGILADDRLTRAATLFRTAAGHWSAVATRAAVAASSVAASSDAASSDAASSDAASSDVAGPEVVALFADLADLVDAARSAEEAAVGLLGSGTP